jgi:hypothetical protein
LNACGALLTIKLSKTILFFARESLVTPMMTKIQPPHKFDHQTKFDKKGKKMSK